MILKNPSRKVIFLMVCVSFILSINSCSVKYLSVTDRVIPPIIELPSNVNSITLLNRSKESNIFNRRRSGKIYGYSNKQILDRISGQLPVTTKVNDEVLSDSRNGSPAPKLSLRDVRKYSLSTDGLLSLELLYQKETRNYQQFEKHQLDENSNDYYVRAVRGEKITTQDALWRLYDSENGRVLLELPYNIEYKVEAEALSQQEVNNKLDTIQTFSNNELQFEIADMLIVDLSPQYIKSNWKIYTKGNNAIKLSSNLLLANKYDQAIRTLEAHVPRMNEKDRAKALLNLATAYLLSGEKQKALQIAEKAIREFRSSDFQNFIKKVRA